MVVAICFNIFFKIRSSLTLQIPFWKHEIYIWKQQGFNPEFRRTVYFIQILP